MARIVSALHVGAKHHGLRVVQTFPNAVDSHLPAISVALWNFFTKQSGFMGNKRFQEVDSRNCQYENTRISTTELSPWNLALVPVRPRRTTQRVRRRPFSASSRWFQQDDVLQFSHPEPVLGVGAHLLSLFAFAHLVCAEAFA
jgi:hypothetical protein